MSKLMVCVFALFIGCRAGQNIEQLDTLEEGVADFSQDVRDIPKTVVRDVLDIEDPEEEEENAKNSQESVDEKIKKLENKVKELEKEKDDASKDLEDIYDKLECASEAKGLKKVQQCLQ